MLTSYRQGIIQQQTSPSFLSLSVGGVNLVASTVNTIISFSHGQSDYLYTENVNINNAWTLPFDVGVDYWLYWDIDKNTGIRTFAYTIVDPYTDGGFGGTLPTSPVIDQHFFDLNDYKMKVWNGTTWKVNIRVFAGKVLNSNNLVPELEESQVNLNQTKNVGHILFDSLTSPIKRVDSNGVSNFVTTETFVRASNNSTNIYKLEALLHSEKSVEPIGRNYCVSRKGLNKIGLASYFQPEYPCIGISSEEIGKDEVRRYIVNGVITNNNWNFPDTANTPIWVGSNGEITTTIPQKISMQRIGHIIDNNSVFIDISEQILIDPTTISTGNVFVVAFNSIFN